MRPRSSARSNGESTASSPTGPISRCSCCARGDDAVAFALSLPRNDDGESRMRRARRNARSIGLAIASVAALAATPGAALEPVKIAYVTSLASAPIFIAEAKGYFRDEGLTPELVRFDSAAPIAVAVA